MRFKSLPIGASFDWIDDARPGYNSFFLCCTKISARRYRDSTGMIHKVGSINATVYHIGRNN